MQLTPEKSRLLSPHTHTSFFIRATPTEARPSDLPFEAPRLPLRHPGSGGSLAFFSFHRREILPFASPPASAPAGAAAKLAAGSQWPLTRSVRLSCATSSPANPSPSPVLRSSQSPRSCFPRLPPPAGGLPPCWPIRHDRAALAGCGAWITIDAGAEHGGFQDMAFWRRRLCALGDDGAILAYRANLRMRVAAVSELRSKQHQLGWTRRRLYLVECEGELLVVRKVYTSWRDEVEVEVRRFRPEERKWEEMEELPGGRALFVSVAVAAGSGVRENCVYFTRRNVEMMVPHAIGVYSRGDQDDGGGNRRRALGGRRARLDHPLGRLMDHLGVHEQQDSSCCD